MLTLFDATSDSLTSPRFAIDAQVTLVGYGLPPGGVVTLEAVLYADSSSPNTSSGCTPVLCSGPLPQIVATTPIMCCAGSPVQLTSDNPVIVLASPQATWLRAVYTGPDLGSFVVTVDQSDVADVTDAMRGCCPPVEEKELLTIRGCDGSVLVQGLLEVI